MPQDDQNQFGAWLAAQAAAPETVMSAASNFASSVFRLTAEALETGDPEQTLEGTLELEILKLQEVLQEYPEISEEAGQTFVNTIADLVSAGIGTSHPASWYQDRIKDAIDTLEGRAIAKDAPTPADVHVAGPVAVLPKRRRRRRTFAELAKGDGLYVCRELQNEAEIRAFYQKRGLELDPHLHVTIVYSDRALPWTEDRTLHLVFPRQYLGIARLGPKGAIILRFRDAELERRWAAARAAGATWDYDSYNPHLTLCYDPDGRIDETTLPTPLSPLVLGPERAGPKDEDMFRAEVSVAKTDPDQRLVYGWVSIIEDQYGNPITDSQGDLLSEEDLLAAAHDFMKESREGGVDHKRITGIGTVVESIVYTRELKAKLGLPPTFPTGWFIGVKVDDEDTWRRVKAGELKAFSIGGTGVREEA